MLLRSDEYDDWMEYGARGTGRRVRSGFPVFNGSASRQHLLSLHMHESKPTKWGSKRLLSSANDVQTCLVFSSCLLCKSTRSWTR